MVDMEPVKYENNISSSNINNRSQINLLSNTME